MTLFAGLRDPAHEVLDATGVPRCATGTANPMR